MSSAGDGHVEVHVWPTYVGLGSTSPTTGLADEPLDDATYERGQITWAHTDNRIEGAARVYLPAGGYDHLVYATHPRSPLGVSGVIPLPHPIVFDKAGWLDIAPITPEEKP